MYNSLYLFVCVRVVFSSLHSSFLSFRAIIWSVCNDWKSVYCTHTGTWANMRWQQKPNSCFGFYSPSPIGIHTLSHLSLMAYATRMVTKKSTRYPHESVCLHLLNLFLSTFHPNPRYSLSLSLSLFCHLKHSRHSHTLLAFTFILIPIEAYFLRLECIYWFYRDSVWWMLIAHRWCLLTANESLFLSHLNILFLYTQCPTESQHTIPMGEVKQQLGYQRACVSSKMQTVSVGFYWILNTRFPKLSLSLSISVFADCVAHQSTTYRSIDWSLAECQTNGEWQPATTTSSTETLLSPPIHGIDKETHPNECESDAGERKKMRRHDYAWMLAGTEHVSTKFYHKIYFNLICVSAYDCMLWQWTNSLG